MVLLLINLRLQAAPHVAGAIALLLSANPLLGFGDVYRALTTYVYQPRLASGDKNCGLPTGADFPNNAYGNELVANVSKLFQKYDISIILIFLNISGYGIIDVAAAFSYGRANRPPTAN